MEKLELRVSKKNFFLENKLICASISFSYYSGKTVHSKPITELFHPNYQGLSFIQRILMRIL